jgi:hypothetical protein
LGKHPQGARAGGAWGTLRLQNKKFCFYKNKKYG